MRDVYDRTDQRSRLGLVSIGLPGIEKRPALYPPLFSWAGFVHHYRPLGAAELRFVLPTSGPSWA